MLFENENIDLEYLPTIKIIDSEVMDMEMKKSLVELLYSKLNCSTETAFSILGFSIEDEKQKRIKENNENYDEEIFTPHASQYTNPMIRVARQTNKPAMLRKKEGKVINMEDKIIFSCPTLELSEFNIHRIKNLLVDILLSFLPVDVRRKGKNTG